VFLFSYDYVIDDLSPDYVVHGVESNIVFGNAYVPTQFSNHPLTPADLALHRLMAGYWTRFAATGSPNVDDDSVFHWPLFKDPTGPGRGCEPFRHLRRRRARRQAATRRLVQLLGALLPAHDPRQGAGRSIVGSRAELPYVSLNDRDAQGRRATEAQGTRLLGVLCGL
jgi:hypothetical protein